MYWFYLIALVPCMIGLILYFFNKRINRSEWIIASIAAFAVAGIMHLCAYIGMTSDQEIWSGSITQAVKHPFWVEQYQVSIYRTELRPSINSKGNMSLRSVRVFDHYEQRYRNHDQYFDKIVDFGSGDRTSFTIGESEFNVITNKFGPVETVMSRPNGWYSGDPNQYVCNNRNGYIIPATRVKSWTNKVKASPSTFSYAKVPDTTPVYNYPECNNMWESDRLLGDAGVKIGTLAFDQMNSRLGPKKKCNVIVVGFNSADSNMGKLQEAKWLGGKKNDIVICYGYAPLEGGIPNVCWTYCFGWTESEQMKRNIEKMFLTGPIDDTILPKLYEEIVRNYQKKDWSKFDTLTVKPRAIHYYILIGIMIITQAIIWAISLFNGVDKEDEFGQKYRF